MQSLRHGRPGHSRALSKAGPSHLRRAIVLAGASMGVRPAMRARSDSGEQLRCGVLTAMANAKRAFGSLHFRGLMASTWADGLRVYGWSAKVCPRSVLLIVASRRVAIVMTLACRELASGEGMSRGMRKRSRIDASASSA